jgi:GT2 family glycosyltransferase
VSTVPYIVAVVLHYRRELMTVACVESLERQGLEQLRICIVDNNSSDGSAERLRQRFPAHAHLATGENLGYAGGNNRGIAWALEVGAAQVLVINDDAEVAPGCVAQLSAALALDPQAGAAAPLIVHDSPPNVVWWAGGRWDAWRISGHHVGYGQPVPLLAETNVATATDCLTGCCLMFRADALRREGAFRGDFGSYVEDLELSLRYRAAGWRLLYVAPARAVHKVSFPEPAPEHWKIERRDQNRQRVARLHLAWWQRIRFSLLFALTRMALLTWYLWVGDSPRARAIWRGWRS